MNTESLTRSGSASTGKKSSFRKNILTLAVIQALACSSGALYAANITVTSLTDTATAGKCTIREAIQAANTDAIAGDCSAGSGTDTITFDPSLSGSKITLGGSELVINSDLTIDGDIDNDGTADITVDANNTSRVFNIASSLSNKTVSFDGLTITGGNETEGGGIFCQYSSSTPAKYCNVSISNSTITGNTATTGYGGGIRSFSGNISLSNTTVSGNASTSREGGGIASFKGSLNLTNSTVSGNTAEGKGGGIAVYYASVSLTNSTVSGNIANRSAGGGISSKGYNAGTINLTNSTVANNSARGGGGIYSGYANVSLTDSTISDNSVANPYGGGRGSGINSRYGNLTLTNSTVSGNTTDAVGYGGGIYKQYDNLSLVNSTVSGNSAGGNGGGIYVAYNASLNLSNSTITDNTAGSQGGGVFGDVYSYAGNTYGATFNLVNSILANNTGGDCSGVVNTNTANLITDNGAGCGITPALSADPMLGALANNGGPTQTHLPQTGSPVLDAGDNAACVSASITTDQRGAPRDDGACDIGAVEGSVSLLPLTSVQFDSTTATVSEDGTSITLNLTRSGDTASAISVDYTTADGTATAPADYTANMNTLNFASGVTSQSVTIDITDDTDVESDEDFTVALSNIQLVSGAAQAALGANASATVTITDDDTAAGSGSTTTTTTTTTGSSSSSSALSLSPWWMMVLGFTGWLRRKFKS